jgi:ArsR family transcriptional regulator, arsenate/arsenite/antimonite-responsive transcriptional repressor
MHVIYDQINSTFLEMICRIILQVFLKCQEDLCYTLAMDTTPDLDKIALALSDPLRLQILDLLAAGRHDPCVSPDIPELPTALCALDLQSKLGDIGASKLAYHLRELRDIGLVQEHKQGKWVYYLLNQGLLHAYLHRIQQRFL